MNQELKNFHNKHTRQPHFVLSEQGQARIKDKIFANLGAQILEAEPVSLLSKFKSLFLRSYVLVPLVCMLFIITGTAIASANSLPGDKLYGIKRQVEKIQLLTAPNEEAKMHLQINFAQRRLDEEQKLEASSKDDDQNNHDNQDDKNNSEKKKDLLNIDSDSHHKRSEENNRKNEYQTNVRAEAKSAAEFLNETKKKLLDRGQSKKADQIGEKLKQLEKERTRYQPTKPNDQSIENRASGNVNGEGNFTGGVNGPATGSVGGLLGL